MRFLLRAVDNQQLADMLNGGCIEFAADGLQHVDASLTVVSEYADLDKTVSVEVDADFFHDGIRQSGIADHDDRVEIVSL